MIYRLQQDATAINLRMGSGGRLTSGRCHEITWPSSGRPLAGVAKTSRHHTATRGMTVTAAPQVFEFPNLGCPVS
ncbi:hypothetical protein ELH92_11005 [Rhizobium ruizarguesonis]|nr:hypothetical protein [Rhizobium ruizarguesonis]TAU05334.1 hypothetical protein ELI55_10920 [Rhizobium ruizarguesonis]TAW56732.1 hypothetical protein ELI17_10530 [Rhizobium ruizarguesonis]TAY21741.1 hypothetical protein ELH92_11005 [Rhizobium ruizarguesonis]TAZ40422.1 hypothetical protein ELH74_13895 [Rhizobium ruizarguesonis]